MLDLDKESFNYNGWHFEFYRDVEEMYQIFVIAKQDDKRIWIKLKVQEPSPFDSYYQLFINKWMEKAEKQAIEDFKKRVLKGELEFMKEHNYFVRTRDKIYQVRDDFIILKEQELYLPHFQDHIVKTANTIEELCDEFVINNWKEKGKPIICKYDKERSALFYFNEHGMNGLFIQDVLYAKCSIYGAIWVDAELKSVAKMNEDGVLCLI